MLQFTVWILANIPIEFKQFPFNTKSYVHCKLVSKAKCIPHLTFVGTRTCSAQCNDWICSPRKWNYQKFMAKRCPNNFPEYAQKQRLPSSPASTLERHRNEHHQQTCKRLFFVAAVAVEGHIYTVGIPPSLNAEDKTMPIRLFWLCCSVVSCCHHRQHGMNWMPFAVVLQIWWSCRPIFRCYS